SAREVLHSFSLHYNSFSPALALTHAHPNAGKVVFRLRSSANKIAKPLQHIFWNTTIFKGQKMSCNALMLFRSLALLLCFFVSCHGNSFVYFSTSFRSNCYRVSVYYSFNSETTISLPSIS